MVQTGKVLNKHSENILVLYEKLIFGRDWEKGEIEKIIVKSLFNR